MENEIKHPVQPLVKDPHGVLRFKENKIVTYLLDAGEIMDVLDDLEEKFELNNASRDIKFFSVNLKGHGCIIGASDLSYFKNIEFFARPFPEKFILPA